MSYCIIYPAMVCIHLSQQRVLYIRGLLRVGALNMPLRLSFLIWKKCDCFNYLEFNVTVRKYIDRYDILPKFFLSVLTSSFRYAIHTTTYIGMVTCLLLLIVMFCLSRILYTLTLGMHCHLQCYVYMEANHKLTNETTFIKDNRII